MPFGFGWPDLIFVAVIAWLIFSYRPPGGPRMVAQRSVHLELPEKELEDFSGPPPPISAND